MSAIPAKVDVVVAGSGATGLAAAVTLAEGGASVAVFEKQKSLGGTSNFFHGTFAVESDLQRERYIDYSRDEAFRNIMEYSHWRANARLVRAIVDESASTIAWLKDRGVEFTGQMVNMPGAPSTYHVIKGGGEAVIKALATRAKEAGAQLFPGTPVVALSKTGGRFAGVVVDDDGTEVEVAARALVIATGGFLNNKEWVKKYTGYELGTELVAVGNTGKTGDGIRLAWEAGAAADGLEALELVRVAPLGDEFAMGNDLEVVAMQPDLYVTAQGLRFCDESIAFHDTHSGNANARFRADGYTFSLFDDSIIEHVIEAGIDRALSIEAPSGIQAARRAPGDRGRPRRGHHRAARGRLRRRARRRHGRGPRHPAGHHRRVQRLLRRGARPSVRQAGQVPASPTRAHVLRRQGPHSRPGHQGRHQGSTRSWKWSDKKNTGHPRSVCRRVRRRGHVRRQLSHPGVVGALVGVRPQLGTHRRAQRVGRIWELTHRGRPA